MRSHQMLAAMGLVATLPLATPFARAANAQTYTQTLTFGPIKMSYSDLANIIARTQRFVATARDSGTAVFRNTVGVSDGRASMSANGSMSSTTFLNAPPIAYTASFSYAADRGRIAQVELSLSDYERKATISGTSSEDVDALAALLSRDMSAFGTTFGGEGFRNAAGMILFVIPIVIGVSFFASKRPLAGLHSLRRALLTSCSSSRLGSTGCPARPSTAATRHSLFDMPLRSGFGA